MVCSLSPKYQFIWFWEVLPTLFGLIILTLGAFYELIEWWVALASGEDAVVFLATQGYIWDTQSDMMYALIGGVLALLTLSRLHDKQLEKMI